MKYIIILKKESVQAKIIFFNFWSSYFQILKRIKIENVVFLPG